MPVCEYDVVVVGGGPVGAIAAQIAAEGGVEVLLIEEHPQVGQPVRCTGLLSRRGFAEAGASPGAILREVSGALINAPNGYLLKIEAPEPQAYVIDRTILDRELVSRAEKAGVEIWTASKAIGVSGDRLFIFQEGRKVEVKMELLIGADGPRSRAAQWAGLGGPEELLYTLQAELPYRPKREEFVELFLGREIAPSFFGWLVPSSDGLARVGLGTPQKEGLRLCFGRLVSRFSEAPVATNGGLIPLGPPPRTVADHVIVVGDAAAQAKPTSGGGLYTGIVSAKIAGEVAAKAVKLGNTSLRILSEYEERWRKLLGRELRFGMLAHRLLASLSDDELSRIIAALDDPEILEIIAQYGDIDYPSLLLKELARRPRLWRRMLQLIPAKETLRQAFSLIGLD